MEKQWTSLRDGWDRDKEVSAKWRICKVHDKKYLSQSWRALDTKSPHNHSQIEIVRLDQSGIWHMGKQTKLWGYDTDRYFSADSTRQPKMPKCQLKTEVTENTY